MFTEYQENFILDSYLDGYEVYEIAEAMHIPARDIKYFIMSYNILKPPLKFPDEFRSVENIINCSKGIADIGKWIYDRWLERYTTKEIADATNIPEYRISDIIARHKLRTGYNGRVLIYEEEKNED